MYQVVFEHLVLVRAACGGGRQTHIDESAGSAESATAPQAVAIYCLFYFYQGTKDLL